MAEQNLLLCLETDEVCAVAYDTRQNPVSDTFERRPPMQLLQQTSLPPNTKSCDKATEQWRTER